MTKILILIFIFNLKSVFLTIEQCGSYITSETFINEFNCTQDLPYCCGACSKRYCCDDKLLRLEQITCTNVDFCNSYFDSNDKYVQTSICISGKTKYCCGDCQNKYCCGSASKKLNQTLCSINSPTKLTSLNNSSSPSSIIYICVAVTVFVICMLVMALPILIIFIRYRKKNQLNREVLQVISTISNSEESNIPVDNPPLYDNLTVSAQLNPSNPPPYPGNIKV